MTTTLCKCFKNSSTFLPSLTHTMPIRETEIGRFFHFISGNSVEMYGGSSEPVLEALRQSFSEVLPTQFREAVEETHAMTDKDGNPAPLDVYTILMITFSSRRFEPFSLNALEKSIRILSTSARVGFAIFSRASS